MSGIDPELISRLVREIVTEVVKESKPASPAPPPEPPRELRRGPAHRPLPAPLRPGPQARSVAKTPARLAQGRTGTRYLTDVYVGLRADHAIALDAVHSEVPADFAAKHGWLPLQSACKAHDEYLLHPDHGRRLDPESRAKLEREGDKGKDLQIIAGDGLSAVALMENGPPLVAALLRDLPAAGFSVGKVLFVKYARIGVQDEIGLVTQAKATIVLVGERPGLGTGDSLSIYTAFGPKLGQDNSEKDCISNVRDLGLPPAEASRRCTELMKRTFAAGGGGVKLV